MIGRAREQVAGGRFLESVADGPACLILEGEPGIGKTTVWRDLVQRAQERDCRVLSCRPAATEAKLSFAGLTDLLADLEDPVLEDLPPPQRQALEVALLRIAPGPRAPEQRAVFAGLSSVLFGLADAQPVVVAIDDLQWLDRPSQAALEFTMRRVGERPVGFLCSLRIGSESTPLIPGLERELGELSADRLRVGPLSVGALHQLILERLGHALARPTVVRISTAARGNPFYVLEIAREVVGRGEPSAGEALPAPDDLSQLVGGRIKRLPSATREQLLTVAASSTPSLALLDGAALEPAETAGLIEITGTTVSFSHPLFAAAVYGSVPGPRRREVHRRLAELVSDPEARARHLALATTEASEDIAVALDEAAERAISRGAPDAAADLLELAARLTPEGAGDPNHSAGDPSDRGAPALRRTLAAAECHFQAGDLPRARALADRVLGGSPDSATRGKSLRLLGELRYVEGSFAEAIVLFEQALAEIGDADGAAELHLSLAFAHSILGAATQSAEHAHAAVGAAGRVGDDALLAAALAMSATRDFRLDRPLDRKRLKRALELEDPDRRMIMPMRPTRLAGIAEFYSDNVGRAAALYGQLRQTAIDRGEDSQLPMVDADLSMAERTRGNLARALEIADEGCEIAAMLGSPTTRADMLCERSFVRAALGDISGARADTEEALACGTDDGYAASWLGSARAFLELSLGHAREASEALEPLCQAVEAEGYCNQFTAVLIPDKIEALVALGELERARALTGMLQRHGEIHDRPSALAHAARCRALLAAADGDLAGASNEVDLALEQHRRVETPLELGRTLLISGQIQRRAKQKRLARQALTEAAATFDAIGARLWAARARAELERTGVRHTEGDELTPTELRVAELAAQGFTNRRIAETLFLSAKTIEANLSRIYLKLGIRSRAELGRAMAEREFAS